MIVRGILLFIGVVLVQAQIINEFNAQLQQALKNQQMQFQQQFNSKNFPFSNLRAEPIKIQVNIPAINSSILYPVPIPSNPTLSTTNSNASISNTTKNITLNNITLNNTIPSTIDLTPTLSPQSITTPTPINPPPLNVQLPPSAYLPLTTIPRSIDGSGNNLLNPTFCQANTSFVRRSQPRFQDGISSMPTSVPNSRILSEVVGKLPNNTMQLSHQRLTVWFATWARFIAHDIENSLDNITAPVSIPIPACDTAFDKNCTGKSTITFFRSQSRRDKNNKSIPINSVSGWIDGSQLYGSTLASSLSLRSFVGGKLLLGDDGGLPGDGFGRFLLGDARTQDFIPLPMIHLILARQHNRMCQILANSNSNLTDDQLYLGARNYVIGLIQKITFYEFLPYLFSRSLFEQKIGSPYPGYDPSINPTISVQFSSSAYRIGHPLIPNKYNLIDSSGKITQILGLMDAFNVNNKTINNQTQAFWLRGMAKTLIKQRTSTYVDQMRNIPVQLMGRPFDLFVINTQRNRDHGMDTYNQVRKAYNLAPIKSIPVGSLDQVAANRLKQLYPAVDNLQTYIAILLQPIVGDSVYGELGLAIATQMFSKLRQGDRLWFQNAYPSNIVSEIMGTTLADVISRNSAVTIQGDAMFCPDCS